MINNLVSELSAFSRTTGLVQGDDVSLLLLFSLLRDLPEKTRGTRNFADLVKR